MIKMRKAETILNIHELIILANGWEYFVTKPADENGIATGLVCGFETEYGDFSMKEIEPYIVCRTKTIEKEDTLPAPGWVWA